MAIVLFIEVERSQELSYLEKEFFDTYWDRMSGLLGMPMLQRTLSNYAVPEPPHWVMHLSAGLRAAELPFEVRTISKKDDVTNGLNCIFQMLDVWIDETSPSIIAFSPITITSTLISRLLRYLHATHPGLLLLVEGPHATFLDEELIQDGATAVAHGEYDLYFPRLVQALIKNEDLSKFPALSYRHSNGSAVRTDLPPSAVDVSELPVPCFDLFCERGRSIPYIRLFTQRGCPHNCVFCANTLWKNSKIRCKPIELLAEEIAVTKVCYGTKPLFIADETFTYDWEHASRVSKHLSDMGMPWFIQTRPDRCTLNQLEFLVDHGCRIISFGAESASSQILKIIRKGFDCNALETACRAAKKAGLGVLTYWLIGFPFETRDTAIMTHDKMLALVEEGLTDLIEYFICVPYPGTDVYEKSDEYGLTIQKGNWESFRENGISCFSTSELSRIEIYDLWFSGLEKITNCMKATGQKT